MAIHLKMIMQMRRLEFEASLIPVVLMLISVSGLALADTAVSIQTKNIVKKVPHTVYGQGLLNLSGTEAYTLNSEFQNMLMDSKVGSLRWPNAGGDNLPHWHFDNEYTRLGSGQDKVVWDIWDPYHPKNHEALPNNAQITLKALVKSCVKTGAVPMLLLNWRSGFKYSIGPDGSKVPFRDPEPRGMNGLPLSKNEADKLTSEEMVKLENRLMLKEYFDLGGPGGILVQIDGEVFRWSEHPAWEDPKFNPKNLEKHDWLFSRVNEHLLDISTFAKENHYDIKLMFQFKESNSGGKIHAPGPSLRKHLNHILKYNANILEHIGCSMHYRMRWDAFLEQERMQFGFITDDGSANLKEARDLIHDIGREHGIRDLQLIPHANQVGSGDFIPNSPKIKKKDKKSKKENKAEKQAQKLEFKDGAAPWQKGMMQAQMIMDSIWADIPFSIGFPGFQGGGGDIILSEKVQESKKVPRSFRLKDYSLGKTDFQDIKDGQIIVGPQFYAGRLIGEILHLSKSKMCDDLTCIEDDPELVVTALRPVGLSSIHLLLMNKSSSEKQVTVSFDKRLSKISSVYRYSESELMAPIINSNDVVSEFGKEGICKIRLKKLSLTRIDLR